MENKKTTKQKIVFLSKGMSIFFQVISILTIIGAVGCIIGMITMGSIDFDYVLKQMIEYNAPTEAIEKIQSINIADLEVSMLDGLLSCVISAIITFYLKNMFGNIVKEETPFNDKTVNYLNLIAILIIVSAIGRPVVVGIVIGILRACGNVISYDAIDGSNILISIILFAIAYIFKYGVELQKENDTIL